MNNIVRRPDSGFDFLTPGAQFRSDGEDFVNLGTGEVISPAEYLELLETRNWDPIQINFGSTKTSNSLSEIFCKVSDSLDTLALMINSECRVFPDLNPDLEVGETGTTPLTFGSVEHTLHPIFSEVTDWAKNPNLAEMIQQLSRLLGTIWIRISSGFTFEPSWVESLSLHLSMFADWITPILTIAEPPKDFDHIRVKLDVLQSRFSLAKRKAKQLQTALRWDETRILELENKLAKRNKLIRTLRRQLSNSPKP